MNQLFAPGGQSIGASASVTGLPMNIQGWFPSGLTGVLRVGRKALSISASLALPRCLPQGNRHTTGRRRGGHGSGLPRGPSVTSGPCGPHMEDPEAERDYGTCPGSHSWSELGADLTLN